MEANLSRLTDLLIAEYNVTPVAISDGPRGFVGLTYIVDAADGRRLFAKLLPPAAHLVHLETTLSVLAQLHALGIAVNRPVPTRAGSWTVSSHDRTLVLFDFIAAARERNAASRFDYDFSEYVDLVARVHSATAQVHANLPGEDFGLPFAPELEIYLERVLTETPNTPVQADLRRLMAQYYDAMMAAWAELRSLAEACRRTEWEPLLTHSDAPGDNVIAGADGRLYLVDWDDLKLGPAERDTWFHLNAKQAAAFLQAYRRTFPEYVPDPVRVRYYVYRRFFEDLTGYLIEILDRPSVDHQARNLADLRETCFEWLWPLMREEPGIIDV